MGTFERERTPQALPLGELPPQRVRGQEIRAAELKKADIPVSYPLRQPASGQRPEESPRTAGKPRGNARGRKHVQLPMISYRWLT